MLSKELILVGGVHSLNLTCVGCPVLSVSERAPAFLHVIERAAASPSPGLLQSAHESQCLQPESPAEMIVMVTCSRATRVVLANAEGMQSIMTCSSKARRLAGLHDIHNSLHTFHWPVHAYVNKSQTQTGKARHSEARPCHSLYCFAVRASSSSNKIR